MDPATSQRRCSHCNAALAGDEPGELCLRCLLELALRVDQSAPEEAAGDEPLMATPAETFERYRVLEKIGEGGCGVVYRAEQIVPVRREVALKVIKLGMDTRAVIARFEAERQALAMMDHPHIARVLDAGATQGGRPYFAMELVRGERITDYCDRNELSIPERLELFALICHAIQHAHQKGVIHRDIKPSNILVVEESGRPVPKVIDFGVAKATEQQRLSGHSLYTAFDQFIGTPAYMSPEQATLTGEDIDTRSDIYSLGVLLYELLTGRAPFEPERLRQSGLNEVCRIIREEEPARPSARVAALAPHELTATAQRRLTPSNKLVSQLRGDLDWLVMKALEKDRTRRYPAASAIAADINRLLAHEPITARPPSTFYVLRKFAQRHRPAVITIGAVTISLLAGLLVSTRLFFKEQQARRWAEARAYASDMGLAARMARQPFGLGSVHRLLDAWPDRQPDLRGWEWFYLNGLCHQDVLTINADSNALYSVAWSPDGTRLAAGGASGAIRIWDALGGTELATLRGHTGAVNATAWNHDSCQLASGGADGSVRLWDAQRAAETRVLRGPGEPFVSLAWSPDGRTVAAGSRGGAIKLWNAASGAELNTLRGKGAAVSLSWSHDGSRLAAVGGGELRAVWDVTTGKERLGLRPQPGTGSFRAVAWSPDDRTLATGGDDFTVKLFDAATGTNIASFWGHHNGIISVAWNADGTRLASADNGDGTVRIWDVAGARMIRSFRGHNGSAKSVVWHPSGTRLASTGADGTIRIWDANGTNQSLRPIRQPSQVLNLAWHPDGRWLAVGGRYDSALIWDTAHPASPLVLRGHGNWVWDVAWSPDGKQLATAGDDGFIHLWNAAGHETARLRVKAGGLRGLAWSPDGARLAFTGSPCGLNVCDLQTTNATRLLDVAGAASHAVAWSPDGNLLVVAMGQQIRILAARTGQPRHTLTGHGEVVRSLAWSPDSRRLASASDDSLAKIWNAQDGRELVTLTGHSAPVYSTAWNPDGTRLLTASWDHTVKLWNPDSGIELCSLEDHPAQVAAGAFSPDGARIASSDLDGNIFIHDATPGHEAENQERGKSGPPVPTPLPAQVPNTNHAPTPDMQGAILPCIWFRDTAEEFAARGDLHSMRLLVWFLATCPYAELRDGPKAVALGEKAAALTQRNNAGILDDLAAAYAEAGQFTNAVAVQQEAIALLNGPIAKAEFATRLRRYEASTPSRDYDW